jgi:1,4-alpha-glucan branching enzyme
MNSPQGYLVLTLHTHLPFIRHPEHPDFLEERWLFEAITETYLPLLERFERLHQEGVPFRITMSFTPTLLAMLADPLLQERYVRHLERLIELAGKEVERTRWMAPFHRLALFYHHRLTSARRLYVDTYRSNLIAPFRALMDAGVLEGLACCATHGYLPLMDVVPTAARAQVRIGAQAFEQAFGRRAAGFWLPECGYQPGHDVFLQEQGLRYFLTDAHGVLFGSPRPKYGTYAPVICPASGVAAFGRDLESSKSVWSAEEGYPGDYDYREFYRDIGFDVEYDYIRPYLAGDGTRCHTGLKYYRITGPTNEKQPYDPDRALNKAGEHAANFLFNRQKQAEHLRGLLDRAPLIVSPYDAELFGHWWFEGPDWLELLIRQAAQQQTVQLLTPSEYLERYPTNQRTAPSLSSWGNGGYSDVWLNGANDWIYRHLHKMAYRMTQAADTHAQTDATRARILNQMGRELLLAQSSDWAFILKTQTHTTYAYRRLHDHMARFTHLDEALQQGTLSAAWLADVEAKDNLFPFLDYRVFATAS